MNLQIQKMVSLVFKFFLQSKIPGDNSGDQAKQVLAILKVRSAIFSFIFGLVWISIGIYNLRKGRNSVENMTDYGTILINLPFHFKLMFVGLNILGMTISLM